MQKALGKWFAGGELAYLQATVGKCVAKYTAVWSKLQAKAAGTGSSCDSPRFVTSNPAVVFDRLTLLVWEKKTDDGTIHDKDNEYSLSAGGNGFTARDGTAFTTFLANLDTAGSCLNSHCDWRVPTLAELLTIARRAGRPLSRFTGRRRAARVTEEGGVPATARSDEERPMTARFPASSAERVAAHASHTIGRCGSGR